LKACNRRSGKYLAEEVVVADTPLKRLKGLLGRDDLRPGEALLLSPCNWIHTIGMKFPIDLVFLGKDNSVIRAEENIPPYRFSSFNLRARKVLELPVGAIATSETTAGDTIEFF